MFFILSEAHQHQYGTYGDGSLEKKRRGRENGKRKCFVVIGLIWWCCMMNIRLLVFLMICYLDDDRTWGLTAPGAFSPCFRPINWRATSCATFAWASRVDAPKWGVHKILEFWRSDGFLGGSSSKTSSAAPDTCPDWIAERSADSSMIPPLATLIILTPFLHDISVLSFKRCFVEGKSGTWSVM